MRRGMGNGSLMLVLSMQHAAMFNKTEFDNNNDANMRIYNFAVVAYYNIFIIPKLSTAARETNRE